jgi:diacylglycerol kinase family enzyme
VVGRRQGQAARPKRLDLQAEARRHGVTPIVLRRGDDPRALAEQAVDARADVIGMAGGDGSQALVADVARRHELLPASGSVTRDGGGSPG